MKTGESVNPMSRRELLAYLAGVPLAGFAGCSLGESIGFEGELLSPDFSIGHRLRDGWRPDRPTEPAKKHRVVIVGGGIAGLSAAWQLRKRGIDDFVVLELGDQPGGTSHGGTGGGFQFPWGAHYVPVPMKENESLVKLFREMNVVVGDFEDGHPTVAEQYLCRDPEERVFADDRWIDGLYPGFGADKDDLGQLREFRDRMERWAERRDETNRRMFAIPMALGSDCDEIRQLDQISMSDWMTDNGFDSSRLIWLVDYACRDDYGLTIGQASAWAGIFYFASRLRGDGSESQPVMTWPNGNAFIVDHLAEECADRLRCSQAVTSVETVGDGSVHVRAYDSANQKATDYIADDVVFAAPHFLAPHLIVGWKESGRSIKSFRYGGWIVANVLLKSRPHETDSEMCWDNVIHGSRSLGYVTATHQIGLDHGATVLTWYHPLLDDDPRVSRTQLMQLAWRDWASVVLADLQKAHPEIGSLIRRIDVMRWGHAMIQPRVGFVWGAERENASNSLGRIHFAGTDLSGIALMEEAFYRGIQAADRCSG